MSRRRWRSRIRREQPQEELPPELRRYLATGSDADLVECAIDVLELRRRFRHDSTAAAMFMTLHRDAICEAAALELGVNDLARRRQAAHSNNGGAT